MSAKKKADRKTDGGSPGMTCSAWVPVSNPPEKFTRVIAKNEYDDLADCFWLPNAITPGFYVAVAGGAQHWPHATHYIPWPNADMEAPTA